MCPFKSCYFIFIVFLLGPFLTHAELPAYLYYILTHGAAFEHLSGYLLLLLLVRLLACCLLSALLSFSFFRWLLPVGCRFLTGFCLVSYRGVGVGCEAPHLRSISPNFPDGFWALLSFYASASTGLQGGLVSWYHLSPLLLRRRYYSRKRNNRPLAQSPSERSILSK